MPPERPEAQIVQSGVLARAEELRAEFRSAQTFPHVVVDDFLDAGLCDDLLREFPPYDAEQFRNDYGELGKAWHQTVEQLGPAYQRLDRGFRSRPFLDLLARISGIEKLVFDPGYYGGGTHENLHEMELDPHVDFNLHPDSKLHRRLNLLLYLNPVWEDAWGGALELHTNPWLHPSQNAIKTVSPKMNRCVVFETSDHSWHGFRRIDLPPEKRSMSRRSIAVYFYTTERAPCPLIPNDISIYTDRPLPEHLRPGYTLSERDVATLEALLSRRDRKLEYLYGRAIDYAQPVLERQIDRAHLLGGRGLPGPVVSSLRLARRIARRIVRAVG
jgi:hypothetical protein